MAGIQNLSMKPMMLSATSDLVRKALHDALDESAYDGDNFFEPVKKAHFWEIKYEWRAKRERVHIPRAA
ncbi:hypothetical protein B9Z65_2302 [Elsinoe australis]|uniref:Uncharacterized protein n=1 Tax=Elsinoe australis TaxID=40998 RepID=A0A2P7ZAB5_9PEZI|nr:hypothetical protein B9Z65_2302 [Elsinoe australis]